MVWYIWAFWDHRRIILWEYSKNVSVALFMLNHKVYIHGNWVFHWCSMLRCSQKEVSWSTSITTSNAQSTAMLQVYHWTDITNWLWWSDNNNTKNDFGCQVISQQWEILSVWFCLIPNWTVELCTHSQSTKIKNPLAAARFDASEPMTSDFPSQRSRNAELFHVVTWSCSGIRGPLGNYMGSALPLKGFI